MRRKRERGYLGAVLPDDLSYRIVSCFNEDTLVLESPWILELSFTKKVGVRHISDGFGSRIYMRFPSIYLLKTDGLI